MRAGNCLVKRRMNQMDTGENKLSTEMMKKLYEAYKNTKKKKLDEFNEAARKIISDKEYPEAEDVLKLVGNPIKDMNDYIILTGTTKNFKLQQTCDQLEALVDIFDTESSDRNGRVWKREFMKKILNNQIFLTVPRGHKSWLWLKILEMQLQKSYEVNLVQSLETPPSTKVDLKSVIHMRWPKQDMSDLKAHDFRYGKMWQDQELINYATGDVSHIDTMILDSLAAFGPDINSAYGMSTPNLNIDKKKLERVIKRRKKK
jgi:hypothetical protein